MLARQSSSRSDAYWDSLIEQEDAFLDVMESANGSSLPAQELDNLGPVLAASESADQDPWELAKALLESDQIVELRVLGYNKGGLLVLWKDIQGFVPVSQLIDFPQFQSPRDKMQALSAWIGRTLKLKVIEVNPASTRLIFSERATLVGADERDNLLNSISAGDRVVGTITNFTDFGAFADLGGVEGLLHISEISWRKLSHPTDVLQPGQQLDLLVLDVDPASGKVRLSSKQLRQNPWVGVDDRYKPDQLVCGIVNRITSYGAFVALEEELDGLVHITEMAEGSFLHPRDVVRMGETIQARVLHVDPSRTRIALTLRGVTEPADSGA
ncbi:MAG: S1 RNA-binding domain-containing protein [Chloroflexota bacterium]